MISKVDNPKKAPSLYEIKAKLKKLSNKDGVFQKNTGNAKKRRGY